MHSKVISLIALLAVACSPLVASAEVDTSPAKAELKQAFPNLIELRRPVVVTHAGDGSNRLFIVTQQGVVQFIDAAKEDTKMEEVKQFLDIEDKVVYKDKQNEEGLLGLAFHPKYKENGYFYVYYTTTDEPLTSVVCRYSVSKGDPNKADPESEVELMRIKQPFWNHNGGTLKFGPDGYLYIALGDGGKANDSLMNGQNVQTLLGSILRIDVDNPSGRRKYGIPTDNPFANVKGGLARQEIYAYGLRNPWRMSFDRKTGTFWAADVGQNIWEEINIIKNGGNYGWNLREANHKFGPTGSEKREDLIDPIFEYDHTVGKSITGGNVYRGKKVPALDGAYLYADYVTGLVWALKYDAEKGEVTGNHPVKATKAPYMTFGEDEAGEVYATAYGRIYRFVAK